MYICVIALRRQKSYGSERSTGLRITVGMIKTWNCSYGNKQQFPNTSRSSRNSLLILKHNGFYIFIYDAIRIKTTALQQMTRMKRMQWNGYQMNLVQNKKCFNIFFSLLFCVCSTLTRYICVGNSFGYIVLIFGLNTQINTLILFRWPI